MIRFMLRKWTTKGKVLWPGGGRDAAVVTNNIADSEADQGDEVEGNPPPIAGRSCETTAGRQDDDG